MRQAVFDHAVARLMDDLDPGGGHVKRQIQADRRSDAQKELDQFFDDAATGSEFDDRWDEEGD